jgi:hypothetical protein
MKRIMLIVMSVIALSAVIGCNTKKESANGADGDIIQVDSIAQQADEGISDSMWVELKRSGLENQKALDGAIEAFFEEVFNERYYEDGDGFYAKFCTENLKKKLKEAYEYDGEEGYATWKFRSEAQDGPSDEYKLTKFTPEGNGWYKYEFIDMGIPGSHRIKFIPHVNPRNQTEFYIDDIE